MSKKIGNILESNGEIFDYIKGNRDIIEKHADEIVIAMERDNLKWQGPPAIVATSLEPRGTVHWILEGQHRCTASTRLGAKINYIIHEALERPATKTDFKRWLTYLQLVNNKGKGWKTMDWLKSHCDMNVPAYLRFKSWLNQQQLTNIDLAIYLVGKDNSERSMNTFREGRFTFTREHEILGEKRVLELREIEQQGGRWIWENKFLRPWIEVRGKTGYDHNRMIMQMQKFRKFELFEPKGTREQYIRMLDMIYNKNRSDTICLLY